MVLLCTRAGGTDSEPTAFFHPPESRLSTYPDDPHSYQPVTEDWMLDIFGFDGSLCNELLKTLQMYSSGAYSFKNGELFVNHIKKLISLYNDHDCRNALELSTECYGFLLDISRGITRNQAAEYAERNELIDTLTSYLERNFAKPVTLEELAHIVNLSRPYVRAVQKRWGSRSCSISRRSALVMPAICLHCIPKKVLEIGKICGFESPSYFGKTFKKEVGITPEGYRKNM